MPAHSVKKVYEWLENEELPYEANIKKYQSGVWIVSLSYEPINRDYFNNRLTECENAL